MTDIHNLEILPFGRRISAADGTRLLEALIDSSIFLRSDCGGRGTCGKCKVDITTTSNEKISACSCNTIVKSKMTIDIPHSSLLSSHILDKAPAAFPSSFIQYTNAKVSDDKYGIAVDLGTTTIAVYLCERSKREVVASTALKNPQALYGDDVVSRIGAVAEKKSNLQHLQNLVVKTINWCVHGLLKSHSVGIEKLSEMVVVGNPTMIHILLGVSPEPIGVSPYQPVFHEARITDSSSLGFDLGNIRLCTLPQVSGFIGSDILSAALATDLVYQPTGTLLIDLGTNGELLLKGNDRIYAASCATGPAFEGASLSCGIQAVPDAINSVRIQDKHDYPQYTTINSKMARRPAGLCGTGIISLISELWRKGIINQGGGFAKVAGIKPLRRDQAGTLRYDLFEDSDSADAASVFMSQKDIRSVQLGKAALRTGIEFLVKKAGLSKPNRIIVAGAFGSYIDKEDMMTIGMIPKIASDKINNVGNSAGAGAVMIVSDERYYKEIIAMMENITTINLAGDATFQQQFVNNLRFPVCL